jgi:O-antigen ligase
VTCLCFSFTYWQFTQSKFALGLSVVLLILLFLSTSTTAYAALAVLILGFLLSTTIAVVCNALNRQMLVVWAAVSIVTAGIGLAVFAEARFVEPLSAMLNTMIFEKHASASGLERAYWNMKGLQSFFDTHMLGTGLGSTRSSSWAVSVLAQLGLIGALMMLSLVAFLLLGARRRPPAALASEYAVVEGARAAALGSLLAASISGSGADPGLVFFLALAVDLAYRKRLHPISSSSFARWSGREGALRGI